MRCRLADQFRSHDSKAVIGNEQVSAAAHCGAQLLLQETMCRRGKRRGRLAVNAQHLLRNRMRPSGEEAGLHRRRPPAKRNNAGGLYTPAASLPTMLTGRTEAPRSARLFAALAPLPGKSCVSRWRKIRTGASRETRAMSPR